MWILLNCENGHSFERPDEEIGLLARCPECGQEVLVPKPPEPPDVWVLSEDFARPVLSGKAIASVVVGVCFFFACLSGIPAIILGNLAERDIDRSGGRIRGRWLALTGRVLGTFGCLFTLFLLSVPAYRSAREAARRAQCVNNLKQIGLALHNYHEVYNCLPPEAITDKAGRPLLSWRVAILPFFDSSTLYYDFHLDEPWDSPHNLPLTKRMPSVFSCPSDPKPQPGMTGYQVVVGPGMVFTPDFKPTRFDEITDGLSHTIVVGETQNVTAWTRPGDIRYDKNLLFEQFDSHHSYHDGGYNVLLADGSVRFLKRSIDRRVIHAYLTRGGNEPLPHNEM